MSCLSSAIRKSPCSVRSCTSSTMTCVADPSIGSPARRRSRMPVVQNVRRVAAVVAASRRTWYPTRAPRAPGAGSPRSAATRSATDIAAMRRGWVHTTCRPLPRPAAISASRMYCGIWVVFPHPVSPLMTTASPPAKASSTAPRIWLTGSLARLSLQLPPSAEASHRACSSAICRPSLSCAGVICGALGGGAPTPPALSSQLSSPVTTPSSSDGPFVLVAAPAPAACAFCDISMLMTCSLSRCCCSAASATRSLWFSAQARISSSYGGCRMRWSGWSGMRWRSARVAAAFCASCTVPQPSSASRSMYVPAPAGWLFCHLPFGLPACNSTL
mmetsp:Transcript_35039/g.88304  ORF Transcript_35039/g.88304 Transcript_35039/m.88304 type:complete len:330 (-) Transcript_35039:102-1091(-)